MINYWSGCALEIEFKIMFIIRSATVIRILNRILKIISSEATKKRLCTSVLKIIMNKKITTMKLKDIYSGEFHASEWESKGYELPKFDIKAVREKTAKKPTWVHF